MTRNSSATPPDDDAAADAGVPPPPPPLVRVDKDGQTRAIKVLKDECELKGERGHLTAQQQDELQQLQLGMLLPNRRTKAAASCCFVAPAVSAPKYETEMGRFTAGL